MQQPLLPVLRRPRRHGNRPTLVALSTALFLLVIGAFATPAVAEPTADPTTGAAVADVPTDAVVVHVDDDVVAGDAIDGSAAHPVPTIQWGVSYGQSLRKQGQAVHVVVAPGTYRETITVGAAGSDPRPLVIESAVPGAAVVTGADAEEQWTPIEGTDLVSAPWDQDWGLAPVPSGWNEVNVPDGIRRREAVFVDGQPLVQVLSEAELAANSFYVDEAGDRLVVNPPAGVEDLGDHAVEVSRRHHVLRIQGQARSVAVKGFTFEAGAPAFEKHMAYITDSTDVLIEGNTFRHSSWGALGVCCTTGVTVRDNVVVDNGGNGIDTYKTHDALIEGNHIAGNNVRGSRHQFHGWSVAGSKNLLLSRAVFRNNTYTGNFARGLWLDTDVTNVLIDGDRSCGNLSDGLFLEAVQGPIEIRDSTYCDNIRSGIAVGTSGNVTVRRTTMSNNWYGQLLFAGDRFRTWTDHLTGEQVEMGDFANWSLFDNTFASDSNQRLIYSPVIPLADWNSLLGAGEITAADNTWIRSSLDGAIRIQSSDFSLEDWDAMTVPAETTTTEPANGNKGNKGGKNSDSTDGTTEKGQGKGKR